MCLSYLAQDLVMYGILGQCITGKVFSIFYIYIDSTGWKVLYAYQINLNNFEGNKIAY